LRSCRRFLVGACAAGALAVVIFLAACGLTPDAKAVDAIYEQLLTYIRNANSALNLHDASFDSMVALQQRASADIPGLELRKLCNGAMSYSLSVLPGKIAIWVKCNATEKRGEWVKRWDREMAM
jgi:hypothetical protein